MERDKGRAYLCTPAFTGPWWRAGLTALGLLSLAGLCYHLGSHWSVVTGPRAGLSYIPRFWPARAAFCAWLLYGVAGGLFAVIRPGAIRRAPLLWGTGALAWSLGVLHAVQLIRISSGPHACLRDAYEWLWVNMGRLPWLSLYVGLSLAIGIHIALGMQNALSHWRPRLPGAALIGLLFGHAVFAAQVQLLSYFALGVGLF